MVWNLSFFNWTWSKTWSAFIQLMKTWSTPVVLSRLDNVFNLYVFYMLFFFLYLSKREIVLASLGQDQSHDPSLFMLLSGCGTLKNTVTCLHLMRFLFLFLSHPENRSEQPAVADSSQAAIANRWPSLWDDMINPTTSQLVFHINLILIQSLFTIRLVMQNIGKRCTSSRWSLWWGPLPQ